MTRNYETRQRARLVAFLEQHADQRLSVRQIAQALCMQQISLSAVYRNLARLESAGLLRKFTRPGSREVYYQYVGTPDCRTHLHMSCTRCGKTFHMDAEHAQRMACVMSELDGFELDVFNTVLYGICQNCHRS